MTPASAGPWLLALTDTAAFFADQTDIVWSSHDNVRGWVTMVYATPQASVKYAVALHEFNCRAQTHRTLAGNFYDVGGQVLNDVGSTDFEFVIPGSALDGVMEHACSDFAGWGVNESLASRVPEGMNVVRAADNLFARRR
ncbi:hypothetical protein ATE48_18770 [Candidatus Viadribacter manganicus]|uniref:Surface-adhesin protein E-like domain-containing protein n=1 Tax=Candidatus Viadribacter manganicus TaxID=1759059 RepID=A0A1B1AMN9_9PROT|nr:hypothetical protein ATE48_18770 [Candidatus Viadribacter manganicus]